MMAGQEKGRRSHRKKKRPWGCLWDRGDGTGSTDERERGIGGSGGGSSLDVGGGDAAGGAVEISDEVEGRASVHATDEGDRGIVFLRCASRSGREIAFFGELSIALGGIEPRLEAKIGIRVNVLQVLIFENAAMPDGLTVDSQGRACATHQAAIRETAHHTAQEAKRFVSRGTGKDVAASLANPGVVPERAIEVDEVGAVRVLADIAGVFAV